VLLENKLIVDFDVYSNYYDGFLGQVQVYVPIGETVGTDAAVLAMLDRNRDATTATSTTASSKGQARYRVYTNAKTRIIIMALHWVLLIHSIKSLQQLQRLAIIK